MNLKFPKAKLFVSSEDLLYWTLPVTIDLGKRQAKYLFMLCYYSDLPNARAGGANCRTMLISPTKEDLDRCAREKYGCNAPHFILFEGEYSLDTSISKDVQNMSHFGIFQSAAEIATQAIRYAYMFELEMEDLKIWKEFY